METKVILTVLLISLLFFSVLFGMLIPSSENAKENSNAPKNSKAITETIDGYWALPIKNKKPCDGYCS